MGARQQVCLVEFTSRSRALCSAVSPLLSPGTLTLAGVSVTDIAGVLTDEPRTAGLVVVESGVPSVTSLPVIDASLRLSKRAGGGANELAS